MRVLVTGATGLVGGHTAHRLLAEGHEVTALVRDRGRLDAAMASLDAPVPDVVVGDMTDRAAVAAAMDGADAVVHCAAVVSLDRRNEAQMLAANPAGLRAVVDAALDRGVERIVHTSSTSALFRPGAGTLTGDHPVTDADQGYGRSKAECEHAARRYQADGAPLTITYPAGILGPPVASAFGETAEGMAKFVAGGVMPTRRGSISWIDVRDLAAVNAALIDVEAPPARVMCGGHVVTMAHLADMLRTLTGRRFPIPPMPPAALRGAGRLVDAIRRFVPFDSAMTAEGMGILTHWAGTDDAELDGLGVSLRPPIESLADSLPAWLDAGMLTARQVGPTIARRHNEA